MKKILCLLTALLLVVLIPAGLTACGSQETPGEETAESGVDLSDQERVVNVYNWGEYIAPGDDGGLDALAEFEKQTGIKVNYTNFETNEEMYNVLKNSNSSYDVIFPSDYMASRLREEGMLEKLNFDNIPNIKNIDEQFLKSSYDPTGEYCVPYSWGYIALVYNTKMIPEGTITGFKDMWDPAIQTGGALMFNNSRDALAIAMQVCDPPIDPGKDSFTEEDIDRATDKLIELKENGCLKRYVMDQVFTEMEGSQAAIAPYYAGDISTMMDNNEDLDYVIPEEGSNFFVDNMCIHSRCKHKKNAEIFINFMLEPEIAAANAEYIYYCTPNKEALKLLDEDFFEDELVNPPQEYKEKCFTFSNIDDRTYSLMQENFIKACTGKAQTGSKVAVLILLSVIVLATLVLMLFNIRRAIRNRGRINKI